MKTHKFDALSFAAGLVATAVGLVFLLPAQPADLVDVVTGAGSWLLAGIFLTIGVAVLAPLMVQRSDDDSAD